MHAWPAMRMGSMNNFVFFLVGGGGGEGGEGLDGYTWVIMIMMMKPHEREEKYYIEHEKLKILTESS